jgi:thioredoxin 1
MLTNLTDQNFEEEIKKSEKPVLVDFFATWCGPCEVLGPIIEKVAENLSDQVVLAKVNVDQFPTTSGKFKIDRIPNVILFKDGKQVDGFIGLMSEEAIKTWLEKALGS